VCTEPDEKEPARKGETRRRRTAHFRARQAEGRPTGTAFNDVRRARQGDVFVQPDGRYVVRGPRGREHIFDADGTHITAVRRSQSAHELKITRGERLPITREGFERLKEILR
jgi:hypothetical protein